MSKEKKEKGSLWSVVWVLIGLTVAYILIAVVLYRVSDNWEDRGTFGDMFGVANAFFSVLALGAVIYTTYLQRQDLKLQREIQETQLDEIKAQTESTEMSAKQLEEQHRLLNFQLTQETVMNFMRIKKELLETLQDEYMLGGKKYDGKRSSTVLRQAYGNNPKDHIVQSYFRVFFYTLQYITDAEISENQRGVLGRIVNAETNDEEIDIIYDSLTNVDQHREVLMKTYGFYDRVTAEKI